MKSTLPEHFSAYDKLMDEPGEDEREKAAREMLDDFVPDLLTQKGTEIFVNRLLATPSGCWVSVRALCDGIEGADDFFRSLDRLSDTDLFVVWLDHPGEPSDYVFVQFYMECYFWHSPAIYNRSVLDH